MKIAVDYQENIAAGLQILEQTWNDLYADGIIANNGDPKYLENWYFAAWAYNSGIQPNGQYNTTGCTPGPSCTGPDGTWGMGWANNPENPDYPPNRQPYLQTTYADAAHPADWPYQERIMGWMGSPIIRYSSAAYNPPTYHGGQLAADPAVHLDVQRLRQPLRPDQHSTPSQPDAGHCMLNDYECWWHSPVTWISNCATTCATSAYEVSGGSRAVPTPARNPPSCNVDRSSVPRGAIMVDDQPSPPLNLQGCAGVELHVQRLVHLHLRHELQRRPDRRDRHPPTRRRPGRAHPVHPHRRRHQPSLINTGTWTPSLPSLQYYKVKLHLPGAGRGRDQRRLHDQPRRRRIALEDQGEPGLELRAVGHHRHLRHAEWRQRGADQPERHRARCRQQYSDYDVAFDAVAFIPMGGTPGQPIGGPPTVQDEPKGSNPAWVQCGCGGAHRRRPGGHRDRLLRRHLHRPDHARPGRAAELHPHLRRGDRRSRPAPTVRSRVNGPFGWGWTFSYNLSAVTNATTGDVTMRPGGRLAGRLRRLSGSDVYRNGATVRRHTGQDRHHLRLHPARSATSSRSTPPPAD